MSHGRSNDHVSSAVDEAWYLNEYSDVRALGVSATQHYALVGKSEHLCPRFDPVWYLEEYLDVRNAEVDPFEHYRNMGKAEGRHPFFDADWYLAEYPDVQAGFQNAYDHYRTIGRDQGRHPRFDRDFYLDEYPDVAESGLPAYAHYVLKGRYECRHPAFGFDWYCAEYPDVMAAQQPAMAHYISIGRHTGRHPAFSRAWYLSENPDVAASHEDPYVHYLRIGRTQSRHPAFSRSWYVGEYSDLIGTAEPYAHYRTQGQSAGLHPAFDRRWYVDAYADIRAAGLDPFMHYVDQGRREVRYPAFDRRWYAIEYADVMPSHEDPRQDYREHGGDGLRQAAFARAWYLEEYGDVARSGMDPLAHYWGAGRDEGRRTHHSLPNKHAGHSGREGAYPAPFDSFYELNEDFSDHDTDVKLIALYLPQFHEVAQNNEWWGEGFTEWTNTKKATPRFEGHYQPRIPHEDIGYYNLSDVDVLRRQAALAKSHGIHGFCFYHYWFSGQRLLEKPVDLLLKNADIDLPFCLCWANENWTRTWDGLEADVLIGQKYLKDDPVRFIDDIAPYFNDARYIRVDGKPVIMVYKPQAIPDFDKVVKRWRKRWREIGGTDLVVWANRTDYHDQAGAKLESVVDAMVEFPPHVIAYEFPQSRVGMDTDGHVFDYQRFADDVINGTEKTLDPVLPFHRTAMLAWDNSARRDKDWSVWYGFSLQKYYDWLVHLIEYTRREFQESDRFVFINAWNEWGEGTYLEPDQKSGYANLNTTSRALFGLPFLPGIRVLGGDADLKSEIKVGTVAVHLHVYYEKLAEGFLNDFKNIPGKYDLFITTDSAAKAKRLKELFAKSGSQAGLSVEVFENYGRDVAPFVQGVGSRLAKYDLVGHFHTKRSPTVEWGDRWCRYLVENLVGTVSGTRELFRAFSNDPALGFVYPANYPLIEPFMDWGGVKERCAGVMRGLGYDVALPEVPVFAAGNMFWARADAIRPLLEMSWSRSDFEDEDDQLNGTLAHCLERLWPSLGAARGYSSAPVLFSDRPKAAHVKSLKRLGLFVHYEADGTFSEADAALLAGVREQVSEVWTATNCRLDAKATAALSALSEKVIVRRNVGFDFAAWRDLLRIMPPEKLASFDEVVLFNNSCYGPVFPLSEAFDAFANSTCDFWGLTSFPRLEHTARIEAAGLPDQTIPEHLQSYFTVYKRTAFLSDAFKTFFANVGDRTSIIDVVAEYETQLTATLVGGGLTFGCYIPEASVVQEYNASDTSFNSMYSRPVDLLKLRCPLVKKKVSIYNPGAVAELKEIVAGLGTFPVDVMFKTAESDEPEK